MNIDFDDFDNWAPPIERIVAVTLSKQENDAAKHNGKLALDEASAAAACGIQRHALRDARMRGELTGTRPDRRICYEICELRAWMEKNRV